MAKKWTVRNFFKLPGVIDIKPLKARGEFARALAIEANAGECTPEAEAALDEAIEIIEMWPGFVKK